MKKEPARLTKLFPLAAKTAQLWKNVTGLSTKAAWLAKMMDAGSGNTRSSVGASVPEGRMTLWLREPKGARGSNVLRSKKGRPVDLEVREEPVAVGWMVMVSMSETMITMFRSDTPLSARSWLIR